MSGVLVTAATTPVGVALIERLLARGARAIVAVGREPRPQALYRPGISYHRADLRRRRSVWELMFGPVRDLHIDTIVHTAPHRDARDCGRDVRALNVDSTRELLRLAERHPTLRRFVFRSDAAVYRVDAALPGLVCEDYPLDLGPQAPQWQRDRVEADLTVCTRMGMSDLEIAVLRCAEVFAPDSGSQLWDYVQSRVCLRPLGFDPMVDLLSVRDAAEALARATAVHTEGIFNIGGADLLPLSRVIARCGRRDVPLPGPLLDPLYVWRARLTNRAFRYDMNRRRFHFGGVLDRRRAESVLGYRPRWSALDEINATPPGRFRPSRAAPARADEPRAHRSDPSARRRSAR